MFETFTDQARRAVISAEEEARTLRHSHIGTEHILFGLLHEGGSVAVRALESLGISLEDVRQQVEDFVGRGQRLPYATIPFTPAGQDGPRPVAARGDTAR